MDITPVDWQRAPQNDFLEGDLTPRFATWNETCWLQSKGYPLGMFYLADMGNHSFFWMLTPKDSKHSYILGPWDSIQERPQDIEYK